MALGAMRRRGRCSRSAAFAASVAATAVASSRKLAGPATAFSCAALRAAPASAAPAASTRAVVPSNFDGGGGGSSAARRRFPPRSHLGVRTAATALLAMASREANKRGRKQPGRQGGSGAGLDVSPGHGARPPTQRSATLVTPLERWAGAGVGSDPPMKKFSEDGLANNAVTLKADMRVGDAIKALLSTNAVCVTRGEEDVFYVRLSGTSATPPTNRLGEDLFCVSLADLLESPRQMPLDCLLDGAESKEECELYASKPEPYMGRDVLTELASRLPWLLALLVFLTVSSAILEYYDDLLQRHLVIAFYLTALVGCGGNSGSQASSLVLQALATGEVVPALSDVCGVMKKELLVSFGVAAALSIAVALRIALFGGNFGDAAAIALAMSLMVVFSVLFGASVPLVLQRLGADPAKVSGPLLSTVIDIVGVVVACFSAQLLESMGAWS